RSDLSHRLQLEVYRVGEYKPTPLLAILPVRKLVTPILRWGVPPQDERQPVPMIGKPVGIKAPPARSSAWLLVNLLRRRSEADQSHTHLLLDAV
ncbi:MAG: hypothetical protein PVI67_01415, partial [Anaerolineae bacterium]